MAMMILDHDQGGVLPQDGHRLSGEHGDDAVEHTILRLIDGGEDTGNNNDGQDIGDIENDPEQILAP